VESDSTNEFSPITNSAPARRFRSLSQQIRACGLSCCLCQPAKCPEFYTTILRLEYTDYRVTGRALKSPRKDLHFLLCDNLSYHSLALCETGQAAGLIHMMLKVVNSDEIGYGCDGG
jgi:hypothetical protein